MQLLKNDPESTELRLSLDELVVIHQAFNEVCNGIRLFDFQTQVGVTKENAGDLMEIINQIINKIEVQKNECN